MMLSKVELMRWVEMLGEDVSLYVYADGTLRVMFEDFEGFDEDWCEVERDYLQPELVEQFEELLEDCEFEDGLRVRVVYASYDI